MIAGQDTRGSAAKTPMETACDLLYRVHLLGLVSYARHLGCDEHEAWDAVQELFLRLVRRGMLLMLSGWGHEQQQAWLMRSLQRRIFNLHRDRTRMKRGGGLAHESLENLLEAGGDIPVHTTPATEHDRRWALGVMERGMARLRDDMKPAAWSLFEASLRGHERAATPAMRVAVHRARQRLRAHILRECDADALHAAACAAN